MIVRDVHRDQQFSPDAFSLDDRALDADAIGRHRGSKFCGNIRRRFRIYPAEVTA